MRLGQKLSAFGTDKSSLGLMPDMVMWQGMTGASLLLLIILLL